MAGLPWFKLDTDFAENPKVRALASRLREPLADAYVARLYAYCYRQCVDRFDPDVAGETVEDAVRWKGRRGTLFKALHEVGILERVCQRSVNVDKTLTEVVVHGVDERLGPHVAKRLKDAERQRKARGAFPLSPSLSPRRSRDVAATSKTPSLSTSTSPSESRSPASDETRTETVLSGAAASPAAPLNGQDLGLDAETQAMLRLLPAKAVDMALTLHLPIAAVDQALEELRGRGLVRLGSGLVPLWEVA